jgi:hypothetical protein
VEVRHGFNNGMTSLLGNDGLLLQTPDSCSARLREQLQTIQAMALHMMQRFTSLDLELQTAESDSSASAPSTAQRKVGT